MKQKNVSAGSRQGSFSIEPSGGSDGAARPGSDEDNKLMLQEVLDACSGAVEIMDTVLMFEKIDGGILSLDQSVLCANDLITKAISMMKLYAQGCDVTLELKMNAAAQDALVFVDLAKMVQVLRNLLSNALKFSTAKSRVEIICSLSEAVGGGGGGGETAGEGGGGARSSSKVEALVASTSSSSSSQYRYLRIEVRDFGVGIASANISRLFNEVVQFDVNKLQGGGGSGLGLFVARHIVELHGGKLSASSEGLGKGCSFVLELKLYKQPDHGSRGGDAKEKEVALRVVESSGKTENPEKPATISAAVHIPSAVSALGEPSKHHHVLVVDDSTPNRKMMVRLVERLMRNNVSIVEAKDGKEALDTLFANEPHHFTLVFMDMSMPLVTGPQATSALRAAGLELPVIGVTGNLMQDDIACFKER